MKPLRYLSIDVHATPGGVHVELVGELDFGAHDQLAAIVESLLTQTPPVVDVDAARLRLLDASSLAMLIRMQRRALQEECDLFVSNPRGLVARILTITDTMPVLTRDHGPDLAPTSPS
jgi:anti-anti-sigma factor